MKRQTIYLFIILANFNARNNAVSDEYFVIFLVTEHQWNYTDRGKPKYWGEKPVPVPLSPPQTPHGLARNQTRASAVGSRRLTA
jgi:hypothetical protein